MFKKLRSVVYHVNNFAVAKEWYSKATGVQPKTNSGGETYVAVVKDPFENHIGLIEGA